MFGKLSWLGHVFRMANTCLPHYALFSVHPSEWKKQRGDQQIMCQCGMRKFTLNLGQVSASRFCGGVQKHTEGQSSKPGTMTTLVPVCRITVIEMCACPVGLYSVLRLLGRFSYLPYVDPPSVHLVHLFPLLQRVTVREKQRSVEFALLLNAG